MRRFTFFIAAIAYFFYKFLSPTQERNILVLVETQGVYTNSIPQLSGLKTAFKVVTNVDHYIFGDDMRLNIEKRVRNCIEPGGPNPDSLGLKYHKYSNV